MSGCMAKIECPELMIFILVKISILEETKGVRECREIVSLNS
jgi:hypothetical protein